MTRRLRLILALVCGMLAALLMVEPRLNPALGAAERVNAQVAVASAATYVSLRAINAALSTAQEVEVGATIVASGNLQPLKWLEPVDDTVERVANVIFAVAVVSGVLALSFAPVAAIGFALLAVALLGRCGCEARADGWSGAPMPLRLLLSGCGGFGLLLAVALPGGFALGAALGAWLTQDVWSEAEAVLTSVADQARTLIGEPGAGGDERSWREALAAYFGAAGLFWNEADALLSASLQMAGVFLLRMIVLPTVLLLVAVQLARRVVGGAA